MQRAYGKECKDMADKEREDEYAKDDELLIPQHKQVSHWVAAAATGGDIRVERAGIWALNKTGLIVRNVYRETVTHAADDAGKFAERAPFGLEIPASIIGLKKGAVKGVYQGLKKGILKKVRW
jgi:uncharacterized protein (DUF2141 family)